MYSTDCDRWIRIFEYSHILVTNIHLDIHSYQFLYMNIFGHSFVSIYLQISRSGMLGAWFLLASQITYSLVSASSPSLIKL